MSLQMHETLKRFIMSERRRKKEEDVANEKKMQEKLKKAQMNTQTLEQTKNQERQLDSKLEELQTQKRDLFAKLKKVLNEEDALKKRPGAMMGHTGGPEPMFLMMYPTHGPQGHAHPHQTTPLKFQFPPQPATAAAVALAATRLQMGHYKPELLSPIGKRTRSPSPPVPSHQQSPAPSLISPMSRMSSPSPNLVAPFAAPPNTFSPNKKPRPSLYPGLPPQSPSSSSGPNLPQGSGLMQHRGGVPSQVTGSGFNPMVSPSPGQSAFSLFPKSFVPGSSAGSSAFAGAAQKNSMMGPMPTSHSPLSFGLPPRLPLDLSDPNTQKMLLQSPHLLLQQNGGILSGYPLQRPPQPPF